MYAINIRLVAIAVTASAIFLSGWWVNGWRWNLKYDSLVTEHREMQVKAEKEARSKELALQSAIDNERTIKDDQIRTIRLRLDVALDELRQRPLRPTDAFRPSVIQGATGSELYREDGEFLIREAARADEIRAGLRECYASYDQVRSTFNKR